MKGIIFVVWEKYLGERFGSPFLDRYRAAIGENQQNLPEIVRVYPDELLVKGLATASKMSLESEDALMVEYGRFFMLNGLVEYLCGYLLAQSWSGYELLLQMRDAHAQMRRTPDGINPPLFEYEVLSGDHKHMMLTYESNRRLCSLLEGCIYGAAERFGEKVRIRQHTCQKKGDSVCRFEILFEGDSWAKHATPDRIKQEKERLSKQGLSNLILQVLSPNPNNAMDMFVIKKAIEQHQGSYFPEIYQKQQQLGPVHISQVFTTLAKLQQVGLVSSTANQGPDSFTQRLYWRSPTHD
ncbi:heme NO-binding domain-containing protein [Ktedonospora formicarum]|uniref:Heme NO-binding domain-containing protein n=1 Tax=Ktedonospora formicarum TaxID=2778364 RepID=A0A8J3IBE6_9CHLR|nr:heme NO-binding domain-containing protein [Ktedonospora formicarum]GHO49567.1 hypothetical protein KSX_77300 [Ktedonospora formicarum]